MKSARLRRDLPRAQRRGRARRRDELAQKQIDLDRVAHVRAVTRAFEQHELSAGRLGESDPPARAGDRVVSALDHEHRATDAAAQLARGFLVEPFPELRRDQGLRRRLEPPGDAVLDRLRRVRLREHVREEELEEAAVVAEPVVAVVLRPAFVGVELLVPRIELALGDRLAERHGGADEDRSFDPFRLLGRQQQRSLRAERERDERRALGAGRIHDCKRICGELALVVAALRTIRAAVSAPVEREDAAVPREVRDLHLPVARVDDRPRRQKEDRPLPGAVDLVVEPHAVALDVAGLVRVARPRLFRRRRGQLDGHRVLLSSQPSIQSRSSRCPVSIPESRSSMIPSLKV